MRIQINRYFRETLLQTKTLLLNFIDEIFVGMFECLSIKISQKSILLKFPKMLHISLKDFNI